MCNILMDGLEFDANQQQISYYKREKYSSMMERKQYRISILSNIVSRKVKNPQLIQVLSME
uniref:Transposase n=1 Tax=Loa loa TaxID=7209 RepID=A0A1I7VBP0_LOALO